MTEKHTITGWVNIYRSQKGYWASAPHATEKAAINHREKGCVACIQFIGEFHIGQGLDKPLMEALLP